MKNKKAHYKKGAFSKQIKTRLHCLGDDLLSPLKANIIGAEGLNC